VGAGSPRGGFVVRIEQLAPVDREAAAADARRQAVSEGLQRLDSPVEVLSPGVREAFPILAARRSAPLEAVERLADLGERDAGSPAGLDEGDPTQDGSVVAALVSVGAGRFDQPFAFVEPKRLRRDAAARGDLADGELGCHLT
jgi:hypothetical protein